MSTQSALAATLKGLEDALLEPDMRASRERVSELLADDFLEIGASGRVFNKEQILLDLSVEDPSGAKMTIVDFQLRVLSESLAQVVYRIAENNTLRSSIWRQGPTGWRILFHQGTNAPA